MNTNQAIGPSRAHNFTKLLLGRLRPMMALLLVVVIFILPLGPTFISWTNLELMLLQTAIVGTAAVGATVVMVAGGIDLAVGSNVALSAMAVARLLQLGFSPVAAMSLGIANGIALGLIAALLIGGRIIAVTALVAGLALAVWLPSLGLAGRVFVLLAGAVAAMLSQSLDRRVFAKLELSPFIVTLGLWGAVRGLAKGIGENKPIYATDNARWILDLMSPNEQSLVAPGVLVMLLACASVAVVLRQTVWGRHVYAIGSNRQNAVLCGVSLSRTRLAVYSLAGALAGVAGVLNFAFLYGVGKPDAAQGLELSVIASVVIGGASLQGGKGTTWGTLLGALTMTVVATGCTQLELDDWLQNIVTGAIIIAAVAVDQLRTTRAQ